MCEDEYNTLKEIFTPDGDTSLLATMFFAKQPFVRTSNQCSLNAESYTLLLLNVHVPRVKRTRLIMQKFKTKPVPDWLEEFDPDSGAIDFNCLERNHKTKHRKKKRYRLLKRSSSGYPVHDNDRPYAQNEGMFKQQQQLRRRELNC